MWPCVCAGRVAARAGRATKKMLLLATACTTRGARSHAAPTRHTLYVYIKYIFQLPLQSAIERILSSRPLPYLSGFSQSLASNSRSSSTTLEIERSLGFTSQFHNQNKNTSFKYRQSSWQLSQEETHNFFSWTTKRSFCMPASQGRHWRLRLRGRVGLTRSSRARPSRGRAGWCLVHSRTLVRWGRRCCWLRSVVRWVYDSSKDSSTTSL